MTLQPKPGEKYAFFVEEDNTVYEVTINCSAKEQKGKGRNWKKLKYHRCYSDKPERNQFIKSPLTNYYHGMRHMIIMMKMKMGKMRIICQMTSIPNKKKGMMRKIRRQKAGANVATRTICLG